MRLALALTVVVLLGCVAGRLRALPQSNHDDRVVRLQSGQGGPLVGQYADGTLGLFTAWSNGTMKLVLRTPYRVKQFATSGGLVCLVAEEGAVHCLESEKGRELESPLPSRTVEEVAFVLDRVLCGRAHEGAVHCSSAYSPSAARAEAVFAKLGPAKRLIDGTHCIIDPSDRLRCSGQQVTAKGVTYEPETMLEHVREAVLYANGPYAVTGCALTTSGQLMCSGSNRHGEQGTGRRSWSEGWHEVKGLPRVRSFFHHPGGATCVIEDEGAADGAGPVWCWGTGFGPDFEREAAKIPDCPRHTKKVTIPPCPPSGANGDNPCLRAGGQTYERVVEQIEFEHDAADQCPEYETDRYVPTPTRVTLVPRARQVRTSLEHAQFLRDDGVVVNTFYGTFTEATPPAVR